MSNAELIKNRVTPLLPDGMAADVCSYLSFGTFNLSPEVCEVYRKNEPYETAIGPIPDGKDNAEVLAYRKRRMEWISKRIEETKAKIKETAKILRKNGIRYRTIKKGMCLIVTSV